MPLPFVEVAVIVYDVEVATAVGVPLIVQIKSLPEAAPATETPVKVGEIPQLPLETSLPVKVNVIFVIAAFLSKTDDDEL